MKLLPQTVMIAIQSLEAQTRLLDSRLENDEVENPAEVEQTLLTFDLAAADLKKYYEELSKEYADLPSYDRLIEAVSQQGD